MKRTIVEINAELTYLYTGRLHDVARAVVRSDKICGLQETLDGHVKLSIKTSEVDEPFTVIVNNSFDELANFMVENS